MNQTPDHQMIGIATLGAMIQRLELNETQKKTLRAILYKADSLGLSGSKLASLLTLDSDNDEPAVELTARKPLPAQEALKEPLLEVLQAGPQTLKVCCERVARRVGIDLADSRYKTFTKRLAWTKQELVWAGVMKTPQEAGYGIWALATNPASARQ